MSNTFDKISPTITAMIRLDHIHALAASHRYGRTSFWWRKRAIVSSRRAALEIHAQLEVEIFHSALMRVTSEQPTLKKSWPEHDRIRVIIARMRVMGPQSAAYDPLFMQLMREAIHHVADEETVSLPMAERTLRNDLRVLGA